MENHTGAIAPTEPLTCHLIHLVGVLAKAQVVCDIYPLGFESTSYGWHAEATQLSGPKLTVSDGHMHYVKRFRGYAGYMPRGPLTTDCQCVESASGWLTSPNLARPCPVHDAEVPNEPSERKEPDHMVCTCDHMRGVHVRKTAPGGAFMGYGTCGMPRCRCRMFKAISDEPSEVPA